MAAAKKPDPAGDIQRRSVRVTRRFSASPERVFEAWINPEVACKWLFTDANSQTDYALDTRVGGAYTITRQTGGRQFVGVGEYLEIDPPRRLVFTFAMPQFAPDVDRITVEIAPDGDGCILTLTQEGLRPGYEGPTIHGWGKLFDALEETVESG